jgi:preprotein translocase subunit SecF
MSDFNETDILASVNAELNNMDPEKMKEELLKLRTRQKVQQKKNYGSEKQKAYQLKQRERNKALIAKAKELGIYDEINDAAEEAAEQKLAEEKADAETVEA